MFGLVYRYNRRILFFVVIFFATGVLFCSCNSYAESYASVLEYKGDVKIVSPGDKAGVKPSKTMRLEQGQQVITGIGSYIDIAFDGDKGQIVKVEENSHVVILFGEKDKIELLDGEVYVLLLNMVSSGEFRVATPCAVAGARGTGWRTRTDGQTTYVAVFDDRVFVFGVNEDGSLKSESFWVNYGFERIINKFDAPGEARELSDSEISEMEEKMRKYLQQQNVPGSKNFKIYKKALRMDKMLSKSGKMTDDKRDSILDEKDDSRKTNAEDRGGDSRQGKRQES